jgi:cell division protein FtsB
MRKTVTYFILFFQILLIISLVKGVHGSLQSRERIAQLQARKEELVAKKGELEQRLAEVQSPLYLEKVARDELHLSKPGETVVIVPESRVYEADRQVLGSHSGKKPNYLKWFAVLSGKID